MKKVFVSLLLITLMAGFAFATGQQGSSDGAAYPTKPVKVIVPYGAGGGTDLTSRILVKEMETILGESFTVENISGASGTVGTVVASNAVADGYTLLFAPSDPIVAQPHKLNVPYDLDSFITVAGFSAEPSVIAVRTDSPWETLEDLIADGKKGTVISRGHSGVGGISHICMEMFFNEAGIKVKDVPFNGGALAIAALLGGHIDVVGGTAGAMVPYIESGEMRVLAVAADERTDNLPDAPTYQEKGFDITVGVDWFLFAPKGTPAETVAILEKASMEAANSDAFKAFVKKRGQQLLIRDGKTMLLKIEKDYKLFGEMLK